MPLSTDGQWGPEALLDGAGNAQPDATVTVPSGYTATLDAAGNLTVVGPPSDSVAVSVTAVDGTSSSFTVSVPPAVSELDDVKDTATDAAAAVVAEAAARAGDVTALDGRLDVVETALPDLTTSAELTTAISTERTSERARQDATYMPFRAMAANPDLLTFGTITRDSNGAATSAPVVWPDGSTGTYTATTVSTAFPGAVDAYTITKVTGAVTTTYTQPAVTRDSSGAVTARPALTVA